MSSRSTGTRHGGSGDASQPAASDRDQERIGSQPSFIRPEDIQSRFAHASDSIPPEDVRKLRRIFDNADLDNSGTLCQREVVHLLHRLNLWSEGCDPAVVMKQIDTDEDNQVWPPGGMWGAHPTLGDAAYFRTMRVCFRGKVSGAFSVYRAAVLSHAAEPPAWGPVP